MVSTASEVVGECGGVTANGYGGSSGVMKIKLIMVMVTQVREYTKNPLNCMYTFPGRVTWYYEFYLDTMLINAKELFWVIERENFT